MVNDFQLSDDGNKFQTDTYWNNPPTITNSKKKISYDDILSSLNLVVSSDGVLKKMSSKSSVVDSTFYHDPKYIGDQDNFINDLAPRKKFEPASFKPTTHKTKAVSFNNNSALEPELKNSTIYNKYFKNYKDESPILPRRPLSQSELRNMLIKDKINSIIQRKRVARIKSKNLLFNQNSSVPKFQRKYSFENHLFNFSKK